MWILLATILKENYHTGIVVANERQGRMIYAKKIASGENTKPNKRIDYGDKGDSH